MSLVIYRRHSEDCTEKGTARLKSCHCPLWIVGSLFGKRMRESLKTRTYSAAEKLKKQIEAGEKQRVTLKDACELFLADCKRRGFKPVSLRKSELLTETLREFLGNPKLDTIQSVELLKFIGTWKGAPITQQKKMERLRSLFKWFADMDMVHKSPARGMTTGLQHETAVEPFDEHEQQKIIQTAYRLAGTRVKPKQAILHPSTGTFAKLLLSSGLRITDAATLTKDRIQNGRIFLYATKNKKPVTLPLPPDLLRELEKLGDPLFPSPESSKRPETISDYWRDQLVKVFESAGIEGHPHRFRHSLAVNMLNAGSSTEDVALVLGNSPAIVAKHYSAYVKSRQERIDREIQKAWQKPKLLRVK